MQRNKKLVSESRNYLVTTVAQARKITQDWLDKVRPCKVVELGLPEIDDRYHVWRVPLCRDDGRAKIGEVVINAYTAMIRNNQTTRVEMINARLLDNTEVRSQRRTKPQYTLSQLNNTIGQGDCVDLLATLPADSIDLIFTSPPYFNARPEYSEYELYEQYLSEMRTVIKHCHFVLGEGRFFVINTSPVLVRRAGRNKSSKRIAVPFDLHRIFTEEGYDFIDDIIWVKPDGAGWATGRGRRFAADRNPLQYKSVPVTEYVLVYRKRTDLLIDWHIRNHPDREAVESSKIGDDYERTNIWRIQPKTNSKHPAAFPVALADKVIRYYSFKNDVVLDPFAGSGTVGVSAAALGRRFVLFENNPDYIELMKQDAPNWHGIDAEQIFWL